MNLHGIASQYVGAVNPMIPVILRASVGNVANADYTRSAAYATPGALTASIGGTFTASAAGTALTVSGVLTGSLWPGDEISGTDGANVLPAGCEIVSQTSGTTGGDGVYEISAATTSGTLNSCTVTSSSTVLNVTAVSAGVVQPGQTLADSGALLPGTIVTENGTGTGGLGTYEISQQQTVASETMTTATVIAAQVQPLSTRDLRQVEGLNLQGTLKAMYTNGAVNPVVRVNVQGGDLVELPDGSIWLVTMIPEGWNVTAGWTKSILVLQDGS